MVPRKDVSADGLELEEHGRFVRRLAWRLLRDEDEAEDVVQETLLAASRARPDPSRPMRPWLATVARNVVRKRFRSRERLRRREEAAARPEGLPSTADLAARAEVLREVADAVHALDEPNRSAILLRYYEDLPPREIAARLDVPVETIRGRLKRGVKQIRARLDRRRGRAGWALPLAALTGFDVPPALLAPEAGSEVAEAVASTGLAPAIGLAVAAVVLAASVGAALSSFATAHLLSPSSETVVGRAGGLPTGPEADVQRAPAPVVLRGGGTPARRRLVAENAGLEERVAELRRALDALRPEKRDPKAYRFGIAEHAPVFDAADWLELARHVRAIERLMPQTMKAYLAGGEPSPHVVQMLRSHNQPLSAFALKRSTETGDSLPNSAFSHPAVMANLIRAVLVLADRPLSQDQELALRTLGEAWVHEEARRPLLETSPFLLRLAEEIASKERFLRSVHALLDVEQERSLFQPETQGRVETDILSPGVLLAGRRRGVFVHERASLETELLTRVFAHVGLELEDPSPYLWVARDWIDATPRATEPRPILSKDLVWLPVEDAIERLRDQGEAIQRILGQGLVDAEAARRLRDIDVLFLPQVVPPDEPIEER